MSTWQQLNHHHAKEREERELAAKSSTDDERKLHDREAALHADAAWKLMDKMRSDHAKFHGIK